MNILIQLSESEKRVLFAFLLLFILLLVLVAFIGYLITKLLKRQGKKIENAVYDVVVTRVITDKKAFKKYARKKNFRLFLHDSKIALIIMLTGWLILFIRACFQGFDYNPFNHHNGFGTVLFLWDFEDPSCYSNFFGLTLLSQWPPLINTPHLVANAVASYFAIPLILVGTIWYLIAVSGLIGRTLHINSLSSSIFDKDLTNFNQNTQLYNSLGNVNPPVDNNNQNNI